MDSVTKLWSVKWTGKKLGVSEVISLLGSKAELTIQYTGKMVIDSEGNCHCPPHPGHGPVALGPGPSHALSCRHALRLPAYLAGADHDAGCSSP